MARAQALELANFICRFGDKLVLLDLADEIVIPAFLSSQVRKFGRTDYFFYQPRLLQLSDGSDPVVAIAGRIVKDTVLEREQIFDENRGLLPDRRSLQSSPSSVFVLILNDHRLLFLRETSHAPSIGEFQSTIQRFLLNQHEQFINQLFEAEREAEREDSEEAITKRSLREQYPRPKVNVIPLATGGSLASFVSRFDILKTLRVDLVETNDEVDPDELFQGLREQKDKLGSSKTSLAHSNPKGLNKAEIMTQINPVVGQGNHRIVLMGVDKEGDTLRGNNDDFRLKVPIDKVGKTIPTAARRMYEAFERLIKERVVRSARPSKDRTDKIRSIVERQNLE